MYSKHRRERPLHEDFSYLSITQTSSAENLFREYFRVLEHDAVDDLLVCVGDEVPKIGSAKATCTKFCTKDPRCSSRCRKAGRCTHLNIQPLLEVRIEHRHVCEVSVAIEYEVSSVVRYQFSKTKLISRYRGGRYTPDTKGNGSCPNKGLAGSGLDHFDIKSFLCVHIPIAILRAHLNVIQGSLTDIASKLV
jgi:hypothetical protein